MSRSLREEAIETKASAQSKTVQLEGIHVLGWACLVLPSGWPTHAPRHFTDSAHLVPFPPACLCQQRVAVGEKAHCCLLPPLTHPRPTPNLDAFQSAAFVAGPLSQMSLRKARSKMTCSIQLSDATGNKKVLLRAAGYMQVFGYLLP